MNMHVCEASSVSLDSEVESCLVSLLQSTGVYIHNKAPAARTHSAPFSEEKSLMAFV